MPPDFGYVTDGAQKQAQEQLAKLVPNAKHVTNTNSGHEIIDPSEHRKAMKLARADRAANSFEVVAREWFAKYSAGWVANHSDRINRRFERDISRGLVGDRLPK